MDGESVQQRKILFHLYYTLILNVYITKLLFFLHDELESGGTYYFALEAVVIVQSDAAIVNRTTSQWSKENSHRKERVSLNHQVPRGIRESTIAGDLGDISGS